MAGRRKRKFNWDELSSEEEEEKVETKRTTRKDTKKVKEENEDDKSSKQNLKDKSPNKTTKTTASPTTRSTRTSVKREIDDDENQNAKSKILKSTSKQTLKREIEDDDLEVQSKSKVLKSSPTNRKVKNEKVTPKKENKQDNQNIDDEAMVLAKPKTSGNENEDLDSKYADLPAISVKSVKIKLNKQDSAKKFNKKHPSPIKSKTQSLITKFKEIKIELSDEQRKWFNEQVQKYDGNYDQEFDKESSFYQKATTARKRR